MKKIMVTGGSGYFGGFMIRELLGKGYDVVNADMRFPTKPLCQTLITDMNDFGQVVGAFALIQPDAVVHLAAIPRANMQPDQTTVQVNVMTAYNVLEAATAVGVRNIVIASSDSSYGAIFSRKPSYHFDHFPLDEDSPQIPQDPYGFSKLLNEQTAMMFCRKCEDLKVAALRFCFLEDPERYAHYPDFNADPQSSKVKWKIRELWNYVDMRDAAAAARLALEADLIGFTAMNIAAEDTSMDVPTKELARIHFPDVADIRKSLEGYCSLTSTKKAKELLGWQAAHSWRDGK